MDLKRYISELRTEHEEVDEAIRALEALVARRALNGVPIRRGRGRPRKNAITPAALRTAEPDEKSDRGAASANL